jgi:hypothetical protein
MSYKYVVVWFVDSKFYLAKYPRPRDSSCKVFQSLQRAEKFRKEFCKPYPNIYKILSKKED